MYLRIMLQDVFDNLNWWSSGILFHQDGAPSHNTRNVDNLLNEIFQDIATRKPVLCSPRSLDIATMYFNFWGYRRTIISKNFSLHLGKSYTATMDVLVYRNFLTCTEMKGFVIIWSWIKQLISMFCFYSQY